MKTQSEEARINAPHLLTNLEMQKYYAKYKMNLSLIVSIQEIIYLKIKDGTYVINPDEYKSVGTHWIASYRNVEI